MWWKAEALDLNQVGDRVSTVYVERCHIDRAENAVVFVNRERTVRLPAAFIGAILIGPGTRITHAAVGLLADSGTSVCWVGEHAVRFYAGGLGPSRGAHVAIQQAALVSRPSDRLAVARDMYARRFPGEDVSTCTMQQLRGREGARVKQIYKDCSKEYGLGWSRREYRKGDAFAAGDDVNRLLSASNTCLYGACHAAVVGVGAVPALGFVHTGSAVSFVLDVADLYKAELTIPLAFSLAASGRVDESDVRYALRDEFARTKFMPRVAADILDLLRCGKQAPDGDINALWDEKAGAVPGGVNWDDGALWELFESGYLAVSGPELSETPEGW